MFLVNWQLALVATAVTPLIVVSRTATRRVSHPVLRDVQQKMADVATVAEENIVGVHVVKSFAQEDERARRSSRDRSERVFAPERRREPAARPLRAAALVPAAHRAGRACCSSAAGWSPTGRSTSATFFFFNVLVADARHAAADARHVDRAGAARDRVRRAHLRDHGRARGDRRPRRTRSRAAAGRRARPLRACLVRVRRTAGRCSRTSTSSSSPGETVALIGHTGSGKTTLAVARPALLRRDRAAAMTIDGVDVRDVTLASLRRDDRRRLAGSVPLLGDGAREHRVRPRRTRPTRRSSAAAQLAQAHEFIDAAAGRLRHGHRRARDHALGRPAPAARDRARAHHRPAHPDPRRRDRLRGRDDRGAHPARPARGDERPDDDHHRPPPVDDLARRRARRPRRRPDRRRAARTTS